MMITMAIEAMAEAVVLTEASGLQRDTFFELILGTLFSGRSYESYSANIAKESFEPGFKARLGLKDLAARRRGRRDGRQDAADARGGQGTHGGNGRGRDG